MSSATEEPARERRSASSSLITAGSLVRATLELHPDRAIVESPDVKLELTGDAFVQFTENLTPLRLPLEKVELPKIVIFLQRWRRAVNVRSSLSMPASNEWSIIMNIEIPLD